MLNTEVNKTLIFFKFKEKEQKKKKKRLSISIGGPGPHSRLARWSAAEKG